MNADTTKEAVPIENSNRQDPHRTGASTGRKVSRNSNSASAHKINRAPASNGSVHRTSPKNGPDRISSSPRRSAAPEHSEQPHRKNKKPNMAVRICRGFFKFVAVCMCLGVMMASVLAVIVSMYAVKITANDAELLDLTGLRLAETSYTMVKDRETGQWVEEAAWHSTNNREWVDLQEINSSPYLKWAYICVEDKDFYNHHGVNFKRTVAAAVNMVATKLGHPIYDTMQGASTLDQQLIKNILKDDEQTWERKFREIFRAIALDQRYEKDTILEAYLNTISLTNNMAGVQAGAQTYFNKEDLSELSAAECASIAAITKNPTRYNPYTNPENHLQRRNWILKLMNEQGKLGDAEYQEALNEPLRLAESVEDDVVTHTSNNSYFMDAVYEQLKQQLQDDLGYTAEEAHNLIYNGGLRIYTTMDPVVQFEMEKIMLNEDESMPAHWREQEIKLGPEQNPDDVENLVRNEDGSYKTGTDKKGDTVYYQKVRIQGAMVVMDYDGQVLGLVGGIGQKTKDLQLNRALMETRQTGSTMKPLAAYALGIDSGLINFSTAMPNSGIAMRVQDKYKAQYPKYKDLVFDMTAPEVLANPGIFQEWPRNYEGPGDGQLVCVDRALAKSMNTIAVRVGQLVGADYMYDFATQTLGMKGLVPGDADLAPIVLGSQGGGVSMVQLAAAYQMFGNGGEYVTPHLYTSVVVARTGEVILDNTVNITRTQAIKPSTAMIMNKLLQGVLSEGTAQGLKPAGPMEAAAKTGTTQENKDYTFVGLTPYYVTSIWWGYDQPYNMMDAGQKNAKPIQQEWKALMETLQKDLEFKSFPTSDDVVAAKFCRASGDLAGPNCPDVKTGYYTRDAMPDVCVMHP